LPYSIFKVIINSEIKDGHEDDGPSIVLKLTPLDVTLKTIRLPPLHTSAEKMV
jgi:hypothetical protein